MTEQQLCKRADKLLREGRMPTLQELSAAILATRRKFAIPIRRARREAKEE
jgi:hypothetical protein